MSIAQRRRALADQKSKFFLNLSIGTSFVLLGQLSGYADMIQGAYMLLVLGTLALNWPVFTAVVGALVRAERVTKHKLQQLTGATVASLFLPAILFFLGTLI